MLKVFEDNDSAYLTWLGQNTNGFVLNLRRRLDDYRVLHRASCGSISIARRSTPGEFTGGRYIKVCSDSKKEISDWLRQNDLDGANFFHKCGICVPF